MTDIAVFSVWLKQSVWQPQQFKAESSGMVRDWSLGVEEEGAGRKLRGLASLPQCNHHWEAKLVGNWANPIPISAFTCCTPPLELYRSDHR